MAKSKNVVGNKILPKVPSKLIKLALDDLAKVEKSKEYEVDMESWNYTGRVDLLGKEKPSTCTVCFAGSVMEMSLKTATAKLKKKIMDDYLSSYKSVDIQNKNRYDRNIPIELYPEEFKGNETQFYALNAFREGLIVEGLEHLRVRLNKAQREKVSYLEQMTESMPEYEDDKDAWRWSMNMIASEFEKMGL